MNENHQAADLTLECTGLSTTVRMQRYEITKEDENRGDVDLRPKSSLDLCDTLSVRVEPMSIVVYSTYSLNSSDPGLVVE